MAQQLNERGKGTFPSQPVANPKDTPGPSVQINAIHTLRSGKEVDNQVVPPDEEPEISPLVNQKNKLSDSQSSMPN